MRLSAETMRAMEANGLQVIETKRPKPVEKPAPDPDMRALVKAAQDAAKSAEAAAEKAQAAAERCASAMESCLAQMTEMGARKPEPQPPANIVVNAPAQEDIAAVMAASAEAKAIAEQARSVAEKVLSALTAKPAKASKSDVPGDAPKYRFQVDRDQYGRMTGVTAEPLKK